MERFGANFKKLKMDFPLHYQKVIWVGGGAGFFAKKKSEKSSTLEYAQVVVVLWAKLNSVTALLSPRPRAIVVVVQTALSISTCMFLQIVF